MYVNLQDVFDILNRYGQALSDPPMDKEEVIELELIHKLRRAIATETKTANVAPVVHGEWIPIVNYFHGKPDRRYYCSECHRVETMKGIYCRLCGAKMDGGNSND